LFGRPSGGLLADSKEARSGDNGEKAAQAAKDGDLSHPDSNTAAATSTISDTITVRARRRARGPWFSLQLSTG
jgi:hypothetical protein